MIDRRDNQTPNTTPEDQTSRGLGVSPLSEPILLDPHRMNADQRMVNRAVRERWNIPRKKRRALVNRLLEIAEKRSVLVPTKEGAIEMDGPADVNAMGATKILVQMVAQNQSDEHHKEDLTKPSSGTVVNIDNRKLTILRIPDNGRGPAIESS